MIFAHITFCIAFVVVVVKARLPQFDNRLVEAAADLGATPVQTFLRIVLPLAAPGIFAGAMLAFTISLDDVVITYVHVGSGLHHAAALHLRPAEVRRFAVDQRPLDHRPGLRAGRVGGRRGVQPRAPRDAGRAGSTRPRSARLQTKQPTAVRTRNAPSRWIVSPTRRPISASLDSSPFAPDEDGHAPGICEHRRRHRSARAHSRTRATRPSRTHPRARRSRSRW